MFGKWGKKIAGQGLLQELPLICLFYICPGFPGIQLSMTEFLIFFPKYVS